MFIVLVLSCRKKIYKFSYIPELLLLRTFIIHKYFLMLKVKKKNIVMKNKSLYENFEKGLALEDYKNLL